MLVMTTDCRIIRTINPKPYLVAVQYGGLASSQRKFTFAISSVFLHVLNMLFGLMTTRLNKHYYYIS